MVKKLIFISLFFLSFSLHEEDHLFMKGQVYEETGYLEEAAILYKEALKIEPESEDIRMRLAYIYFKQEDFVSSKELFEDIVKKNPENNEALIALAEIEIKTLPKEKKDSKEGYVYLKRGMQSPRLWPHFQWHWQYPYMFYFIKEDIYPRVNWEDICISRAYFNEVLEENPNDAGALTGIGRIESLEDYKELAESYYIKALEEDPDNETTLAYYAALLSSEGRYFASRALYEKILNDRDIYRDYIDVVNRSEPIFGITGFYSQENEKDLITADVSDWTVRLFDYGGVFSYSYVPCDRIKIFGLFADEVIYLKNLINKTNIYSVSFQKAGYGMSWNASPYLTVLGGCELTYFSQHHKSNFFTHSGWYVQPFFSLNYSRWHHNFTLETTSDTPLVARDFNDFESTLVDRQFLRGIYEYNFGNRNLIGTTAANVWYINRIKSNQQQIASAWLQLAPPCFWQYVSFRYQFMYGHFNHITSDYYTYRFQTTHWVNLVFSKNWMDDNLITEAGVGHAWQRGFEQGQIIVVTPLTAFHIVHREINAAFARIEFTPNDCTRLTLVGTYTLDTFDYTTASITGKFSWRF